MGLQQFEQRLERLVEGAFAKAFRGELQPVELGKRLAREMDLQRTVAVRGVVARNVFRVTLSREDFERFVNILDALQNELAEAARQHARTENYTFLGPVSLEIGWNDSVARSTFAITCSVVESEIAIGALLFGDGRRIEVAAEPIVIGRLAECTITLDDPNVSRRHAEVTSNGELAWVTDLGSTNGTKVNGALIQTHQLHNGDVVTVGRTSLRFVTA